jgi:large repetitive protein
VTRSASGKLDLAGRTLTCSTVNDGTPISSTLGAGSYTIDGSRCSGLSSSDPTDYTVTYAGAADGFVVQKVTPVITWASPAAITFGTPIGATQLDASTPVPGTFSYSPPAGTVLQPGNGQTLKVTFTPTDTTDYNTADASVHIDVVFSAPCITATLRGSLVVSAGEAICITGEVDGSVTVQPGGSLWLSAGSVNGSLSADLNQQPGRVAGPDR